MAERGLDYLLSETKTRFDRTGAILLSGLLAPVALGTAGVVCVDNRTWNPIFRQRRVGQQGSPTIVVNKFRTMPQALDAEALTTLGTFDQRASKVGRFLRQYGLDEVPQLANVLHGEMSLVGPRPMVAEDIEKYEAADPILFADWNGYNEVVRKALVGPSQCYRHRHHDLTPAVRRETMAIDIHYIESATLTRDAILLARAPLDLIYANAHVVHDGAQASSTADLAA